MGRNLVYNKKFDFATIPQVQNDPNMTALYPTYNPEDFQIDPIPLVAPQLPPVPEAYQKEKEESRARMIYTKSGFYSNETHGFFTIFSKSMRDMDVFIAWIPEHLIDPADINWFAELDGNLAFDHEYPEIHLTIKERTLLKDVYSLYLCPPIIGQLGTIEVTLRSGNILGAVEYLSDAHWPGYDIIDILGTFIPLKSWNEYLYLVGEPIDDILQPSSNTPRLLLSAYQPTLTTKRLPPIPSTPVPPRQNTPKPPPRPARCGLRKQYAAVDPFIHSVRDARWTILERFSRITQYSRDTVSQVLDHPIARLPLVAPHLQFLNNYTNKSSPKEQNEALLEGSDVERLLVDAAELQGPAPIHTRGRGKVSSEEWMNLFDPEGKLKVPVNQVKEMIFKGGLCEEIRSEAWKFLLGVFPWHSARDEREAILKSGEEAYYKIKAVWFNDVEIQKTENFQAEKHRIDKDVHRTDRTQEAFASSDLPNPYPEMVVGTNPNLETMKDILVTYNFYNTELGYVQGMSDLLAPMFVIMSDEAQAFWAFVCFMDRLQTNFYIDQSGMLAQLKTLNDLIQFMDPVLHKRLEKTGSDNLFFCFRWLLVWFKREFEWEDLIELWEILWTDWLTDKMVLFVALAVIDTHRDKILNELGQFDEIIRFINDLTGHIDLKNTLEKAEVLYYQFERKTRAMQHKSNKLKEKLQERSLWNSPERPKLQADIENSQVPKHLLALIAKN